MADARNHTSPNDDLAMPTASELELAHAKAASTLDEKDPDTPVSEEESPKKKEKFRWRNFWICFAISLGTSQDHVQELHESFAGG